MLTELVSATTAGATEFYAASMIIEDIIGNPSLRFPLSAAENL